MRVYNTLDGPLVVDEDGHAVGGREHADVTANPAVQAHLSAGRLVAVADPKPAAAPATAAPSTASSPKEG